MSSQSSKSGEDLMDSPTDLTIPGAYLAATTLNPFEKGGLFLSDEWLQQQEQELLNWANLMLQPPLELRPDTDQSACGTLHRLNALRSTVISILASNDVATTLGKVKLAVEKGIICIRRDKDLHADLGLQDTVVRLLMSYNPVWLRLCLEALYQCNIDLKRYSDSSGLIHFIKTKLVNDEVIQQSYSQPSVQDKFADKMKKFTLYQFLALVYLLDLVKCKKVIMYDSCLFQKESKYKSSREILIEFNKEFNTGARDIIKTLRPRGYEVCFSQTYLHEFDFTLNNRSDLRDGVRITKLAENLVGDKSLCDRLSVPAISAFQKKHNVEIALAALKKAGYTVPEDISSKDISYGHKENTLFLLWHLRGIIQLKAVTLIIYIWRETKLLRQDRKRLQDRNVRPEDLKGARDDRESFLKLRSAAITVQKWFREFKERQTKKIQCSAAIIIQSWYRRKVLLRAARNEFVRKRTAVIKIQKFYIKYKNHQRGMHSKERIYFVSLKRATILVQRKYRAKQYPKNIKELLQILLKQETAAIKIQRWFRASQLARAQQEQFLKLKSSVLTIQRSYRRKRLADRERQNYLKLRSAVLLIQNRFRAWLFIQTNKRNQHMLESAVKIKAAIKIQAVWRGWKVRKAVKVPKPQVKTDDQTMVNFPIVNRCRHHLPILRNYKKYSVAQLQTTLYNLDVVTKLSAEQCKCFVDSGAVTILYDILSNSNKAVGVSRCIELILLILMNLFRAPKTTTTVWQETLAVNGVPQLVLKMRDFRQEKSSTVFCKVATLIWLFAQDPVRAQEIKKMPKVVDMIKYIKSKNLVKTSCKNQKTPVSSKKVPAVNLNWGNYFNHIRAFDSKDLSLKYVSQILQ